MSRKFVIITLGLSLLLGGCFRQPASNQNKNVNQDQNINSATTTSEIDTSDWKTCTNQKFSIQFFYPNSWGDCRDNGDALSMATDYQPYHVRLVVQIREKVNQDIEAHKINADGWNYKKINGGEVFKVACGGALSCSGVFFGADMYEFGWNIDSDQKPPKNLDGIWTPDHGVTDNDIWNILSTVRRTK